MAAPTPTARTTPGGIPLKEGQGTTFTISTDTDISFWEVTVKPPAIESGDPVDFTTMFNTAWETSGPPVLMRLEDVTGSCAYDPDIYDEAAAVIGVPGTGTVTWIDGSTLAVFGYLKTFDPQEIQKGQAPRANFTWHPTNYDNDNNVEAGPVMAEVEGT